VKRPTRSIDAALVWHLVSRETKRKSGLNRGGQGHWRFT
jgi:hypothetical protein